MTNEKFQDRIRALRMAKGLTMEELANAIGVTKSRVNMWENGGSVPREDVLITLSHFFNVSIDYLLGNDNYESKEFKNTNLHVLQRGLDKLDEDELEKAKNVLSAVFDDIFDDEEDFGDL